MSMLEIRPFNTEKLMVTVSIRFTVAQKQTLWIYDFCVMVMMTTGPKEAEKIISESPLCRNDSHVRAIRLWFC